MPALAAGESGVTVSMVSEVAIAMPNESIAIGLLGPSVEANLGNSGWIEMSISLPPRSTWSVIGWLSLAFENMRLSSVSKSPGCSPSICLIRSPSLRPAVVAGELSLMTAMGPHVVANPTTFSGFTPTVVLIVSVLTSSPLPVVRSTVNTASMLASRNKACRKSTSVLTGVPLMSTIRSPASKAGIAAAAGVPSIVPGAPIFGRSEP